MKITLLHDAANGNGHALIAGTALNLALRVTHDDDSAASNVPLLWATFREELLTLESPSSATDDAGISQNQVTAHPQLHAKPEPIFVRTPDGCTHLIGTVCCRSDKAIMFVVASPDDTRSPRAREDNAAPRRRTSGGASHYLTIDYPGPDSTLPADSWQPVYAQLVDSSGKGVPGAEIELKTSTPRIEQLKWPVTTTDAYGWATFQVRGIGLAEKAVDELTGTLTARCAQYGIDTAPTPLTFDTRAGGPGYFSLSLAGTLRSQTPQLAHATYHLRDGSPGKYLFLGIRATTAEGGYSNAATTSPLGAYANDAGTALSYVTAASEGSSVTVCIDAGGGKLWYSDPYEVRPGYTYAKAPVYWIQPSTTAPLPSGFSQLLTVDTSNSVTWKAEPSGVPVDLLPKATAPAGKAQAEMTGTSRSTTDKAYAAGITATYSQEGKQYICATAYSFYNGDTPPAAALCGRAEMSFPEGTTTFSMKDWHTVEVRITHADGSPWPHRVVNWYANIHPRTYTRSIFEVPYPGTTDRNGKCSIRIGADNPSALEVEIKAMSPNPLGMPDDVAQSTVIFSTGIAPNKDPGIIKITSPDTPPLRPHVPHSLKASYTSITDGQPFKYQKIIWSAFPSGQFDFSENPSVTDGHGNATTTIAAVGDDYAGPVTVFARAYNESTALLDIGNLSSLSFEQDAPLPNTAHIALRPLGGDLISDRATHLIEATYRSNDGAPLAGQAIRWSVEPTNMLFFPGGPTTVTTTDANGVAITAFLCRPDDTFAIATVTATAINPNTQQPDTSKMLVAIKKGRLVPPQLLGYVTLAPAVNAPNYPEGVPNPVLATYHGDDMSPYPDEDIYWAAYPPERLSFTSPNPTKTDADGNSENGIICSTGGDLGGVTVTASSPNYLTGSYDNGLTHMSFVDRSHEAGLLGIMIDRPYALNPPLTVVNRVDPSIPDQVITGQVILSGIAPSRQTILISTIPEDAPIVMYDEHNLKLDKQGTQFVATTNSDGVANFKTGAVNPQLLSLQATYDTFSTEQAQLTVALVSDHARNPSLPEIQLDGSFASMPSNVATFKVSTSATSPNIVGTDLVAVILNDLVVYYGLASHFFAGVDVAYALLNTSGTNTICYVRLSGELASESTRRLFRASGTAQTAPLPNVSRTLKMATIPGSNPIGPRDIVAGLKVVIPAYNDVTPGDVITVFFYLSGTYSLTVARLIRNVATLSYTVKQGDNLTQGKSIELVLPQVYVAGYGAGSLQVDYNVASGSSSNSSGPLSLRWSQQSGQITLNTVL